jgi:hypothetical protein
MTLPKMLDEDLNMSEPTIAIPDAILPCQYHFRPDNRPEVTLILAVFMDAVRSIQAPTIKPRHEALLWFNDDTDHQPYCFTFMECCSILGFSHLQWRRWANTNGKKIDNVTQLGFRRLGRRPVARHDKIKVSDLE